MEQLMTLDCGATAVRRLDVETNFNPIFMFEQVLAKLRLTHNISIPYDDVIMTISTRVGIINNGRDFCWYYKIYE
jgi:hypothetical protein